MFGTKTNAFLTKLTTIFAVVFFLTCLSLALLSVRQSRSLLSNTKTVASNVPQEAPKQEKSIPAMPAEPIQPVKGATE
jgi:preprotein translocase subunit SecG